ncbi:uncharacterized protein LOC131681197 [Topomyia yanbarensis]|uniref:uncharacterized protein LOC131681197 n=1 Tax=Topomyia yanbarensis TaxID=2498891 RepID=UPI00273CD4DF|nr:uncharacterized protein LOC131681197 [Topomyia yanbarensis]
MALIISIPKKVQRTLTTKDFRPIRLLSCIGKTRVNGQQKINVKNANILEQCQLLDCRQHAFRKGKGTGSYLASLGETLEQAKRDHLYTDIAAFDIYKAYNTAWREGMLRQFARWGIQRNLENRTFCAGIGGSESGFYTEENRMPKGFVLAVTLFFISMNSIFATHPPHSSSCDG